MCDKSGRCTGDCLSRGLLFRGFLLRLRPRDAQIVCNGERTRDSLGANAGHVLIGFGIDLADKSYMAAVHSDVYGRNGAPGIPAQAAKTVDRTVCCSAKSVVSWRGW